MSGKKQLGNSSPGVQRAGIKAYADEARLDLVEVVEFDESAADAEKRTKFRQVLERVEREHIRHLIFWVWDRTTRNQTDFETLEKLVRRDQLVLHVPHDRLVLRHDSPDGDFLAAELNTLTAKHYIRDLRRRANESMAAKACSGWYPSKPPFGYLNKRLMRADGSVADRGGTIELTDWGRKAVRRMGDLRLQAVPFSEIARILLDENLVPAKHAHGFKGWKRGASRVEAILKDVFYKGQFIWKGALYPDAKHEPVFSASEWGAIQTCERRGQFKPHQHDGVFSTAQLRLTCAECGCLVTYAPKVNKYGKRYRYYICGNGKGVHSYQRNVREEDIITSLGAVVENVHLPEERADELLRALNESHHLTQRAKDREVEAFKAQLVELDERERRLTDLLLDGTVDGDTFKRQQAGYKTERNRYVDALQEAQKQIDGAYLYTAQRILELAKNARRLWNSQSDEQKRNLLAELLENLQLDGDTVRYRLRKPFAVLADIREDDEWRARQDSNLRPTDS